MNRVVSGYLQVQLAFAVNGDAERLVTVEGRMRGFEGMLVRGGDDHQRCARCFSGLDANGGVFENQAVARRKPKALRRQTITRRIRLASRHISHSV